MNSKSVPFVFLGDKKNTLEAVKFYKTVASKIGVEVYAQNQAMQDEFAQVDGALFHFESFWFADQTGLVYMASTPHGGPVSGNVALEFANTPVEIARMKDLAKKLSVGAKVIFPLGPKSWGTYMLFTDKFGVTWHLSTEAKV